MKRFVLGLIIGLIAIPIAAYVYFRAGHPPVAVADHPFPFEKQIVKVPLNARIDSEMPHNPPIEATDANLVAGAVIYRAQCAACHGLNGQPSSFASHMYPDAPQLWAPHHNGKVVGVSDDPPGETYWKIANGIRLTGMPSFQKTLDETQMWQVALLLSHADKPLPAAAHLAVTQPIDFTVSSAPLTPPATDSHRK
ncbi:MAG TPA: cytochrome c [Acidobacteriaceae bacterium]|nr:cytochrome c [Acidobacteriaceae bacterium]